MRPYTIGGLVLIVLGVVALTIRSFTYFTTETVVAPFGFLAWDVSRPHTVFFSPIAGIVAVALGIGLILLGRRGASALRND